MKKFLTSLLLLASLSVSAQVCTGIDMLERYGFEELRGKRVGLVTNPSGVDRSPPGSSVHGIFQARVLEWGAIAFSKYQKHNLQKILINWN